MFLAGGQEMKHFFRIIVLSIFLCSCSGITFTNQPVESVRVHLVQLVKLRLMLQKQALIRARAAATKAKIEEIRQKKQAKQARQVSVEVQDEAGEEAESD